MRLYSPKITEVEADKFFSNGTVRANYQGHDIVVYDTRENREPRLIAGDQLTIYATGDGLVKITTYADGTGLFGSNIGADVVNEKEEVAVNMMYTSNEDTAGYTALDQDEYDFYLKGLEEPSDGDVTEE